MMQYLLLRDQTNDITNVQGGAHASFSEQDSAADDSTFLKGYLLLR